MRNEVEPGRALLRPRCVIELSGVVVMNIRNALLSALVVLLLPGTQARAADYVGENEVPRPIDVARALAGSNFRPHVRKRGLSMDGDAAPVALGTTASDAPVAGDSAAASVQSEAAPAGALDVAIGFALGSADLRPQASAQLDAIAEGLKLLDPAKIIIIDGHTDASGTPEFNEVLSRRRAETVKLYLEQHHQFPASRLRTHGFGQRAPMNAANPLDSRNRRVQFRLG
jgi:outer membrane protein OmpA-like peptidoglycan-associated protein